MAGSAAKSTLGARRSLWYARALFVSTLSFNHALKPLPLTLSAWTCFQGACVPASPLNILPWISTCLLLRAAKVTWTLLAAADYEEWLLCRRAKAELLWFRSGHRWAMLLCWTVLSARVHNGVTQRRQFLLLWDLAAATSVALTGDNKRLMGGGHTGVGKTSLALFLWATEHIKRSGTWQP